MKNGNKLKIGILAIFVMLLSVYMPGYVKGNEQPGHVDSFIIFADLHTDKTTLHEELLKKTMQAAEAGIGYPLSNIISVGDAFTVCYDEDEKEHLRKDIGSTAEITEIIQKALLKEENRNVPVRYVWSDHDRYADIFYEVKDWNTLEGEPIEEMKNSQFIYGAGEDGAYGTSDDENYYVFSLSMADMADPYEDDRYGSGYHDDVARSKAISDFMEIATGLDNSKPLFIASHQPLMANRGDNDHAIEWYEAISEVAQHRDVAFFFGHNHSYDNTCDSAGNANKFPNDYFRPYGSVMNVATPESQKEGVPHTLNFTHLCAGYLSPTTTSDDEEKYTRRGTLIGVNVYDDRIGYTTYNQYGEYEGKNKVNIFETRHNTITGKTEYIRGEELDITVRYQGVDITKKAEITGYDPDCIGKQTVTITYGENYKAYLDVTVGANTYHDEKYDITVVKDGLLTQDFSVSMLGINRYHMHVFYQVFHGLDYANGYQITLADGGREGNYKITLPLNAALQNPIVYRLSDDASDVTPMDISIDGEYVSFDTDRLGVFMLGENPINEPFKKDYVVNKTKTVFVPADSIKENGKYIVVGEIRHGGERVAYLNKNGEEGALPIAINSSGIETVDGAVYGSFIETEDANAIWTAKAQDDGGYVLYNSGYTISYTDEDTLAEGENAATAAHLIYDPAENRLKNIAGDEKYLYYSIHEDQMWNWNASSISNSESSRSMWLYEAVEVPTQAREVYSIYTPNNEIETPCFGNKKIRLEYDLMLDNEVVDTAKLGGNWEFTYEGESVIDDISEDGVVTFNAFRSVCYIKMAYVWGEQKEHSVSRYVKVIPNYLYNEHVHNFVYEIVEPTEDKDGYRGYRCLNCGDFSFVKNISMSGSGENTETQPGTGEAEGQSISIRNMIFPAPGETMGSVVNTPVTLEYGGEYFLDSLKWERFDGADWKAIYNEMVIDENGTYRVALTLSAKGGYSFDAALKDTDVTINGVKTSGVSVNEEKSSVSFTYIFEGEGEEPETEESPLNVREITDCIYNGKALKPVVEVFDKDVLLREGKDYTVSYRNNGTVNTQKKNGTGIFVSEQDAGFLKNIPYAVITGKGNYTGTVYVNFNILPALISDENGNEVPEVVLKITDQTTESNKAFKPFTSIQYGKLAMKNGVDYTVKVTEEGETQDLLKNGHMPARAGKYILSITAQGNYAGCIRKEINIAKKENLLKNANIKFMQKSYLFDTTDGIVTLDFTGENPDVTVTIKSGKTTIELEEGVDFRAVYKDNDRVGKATLTIEGMGTYAGSKSAKFSISGVKLTGKNVSVGNIKNLTYTGEELCQEEKLVLKNADGTERVLRRDADYTVSYRNNVKKGTATVTFTGNSAAGFTGSVKKTFKILPAVITKEMLTKEIGKVPYSKAGATVEKFLTLTYNGSNLVSGKDYTLKYSGNKDLGEATVIISGKGNFTGSFEKKFVVAKKEISEVAITVKPVPYKNKENYRYNLQVVVKDGSKSLKKNTDYEVILPELTKAGLDAWYEGNAEAPCITVRAKENSFYSGEALVPANIYRWKMSNKNTFVYVDDEDTTYNGTTQIVAFEVYYSDDAKVIQALKKETNRAALQKLIGEKLESKELYVLNNGTDYTATFGQNLFAGKNKATLKVNGIGKYAGSVNAKFTIKQKNILFS